MREAERQRVVRPEDDPLGAEALDEVGKRGAIERENVEPEVIEIGGGRTRDRRPTIGQHLVTFVEAAEQRREGTAGVIEDETHPRIALEPPAVDEERGGETGVVEV